MRLRWPSRPSRKAWLGTIDDDDTDYAPSNTSVPVVSGTATVGQVLTTTNGVWKRAPFNRFTYKWLRDGAVIAGAESQTYTLVAGDATHTIKSRVYATNVVGSVSAESAGTAVP